MPTSEAQIKAVRKWEKENYWNAKVYLPKNYKERILATGKSINGFIREAIEKQLEQYENPGH